MKESVKVRSERSLSLSLSQPCYEAKLNGFLLCCWCCLSKTPSFSASFRNRLKQIPRSGKKAVLVLTLFTEREKEIQRSEKNFARSFGGTFESEQPPNANARKVFER